MSEQGIVNLLKELKLAVLNEVASGKRFSSGVEFEECAFSILCDITRKQKLPRPTHSGPQTFPDIVCGEYGIEVKLSKRDSWTTIGNSIAEGTKIRNLKKIFVFFLKQGGKPELRFGNYYEYLSDIIVTHSPRYEVNMDLSPDQNIRHKMGIASDMSFQEEIVQIRQYYTKQGKEAWWLYPAIDDEQTTRAYLRDFNKLSKKEKVTFMVDCLILFPRMFSKAQTKFSQPSVYLLEHFQCLSSNIRDIFTAGGQFKIKIENKAHSFPRIFGHLHSLANQIRQRLNTLENREIVYYWTIANLPRASVEQHWLSLIQKHSKEPLIEKIYQLGLSD